MIAALTWLGVFTLAVTAEALVACLLAGHGRRRSAIEAALWGNLTFEPLHALLGVAIPGWSLAGVAVLLIGEGAVYRMLAPLSPVRALVVTLLANLAGGVVAATLT